MKWLGVVLGLAAMLLVQHFLDASPTEGLIIYFVVVNHIHVRMNNP